jgi:hypothetical protein
MDGIRRSIESVPVARMPVPVPQVVCTFSLLFLPGHYEFSAPPPPRSPHFRSDLPRALGLCSSCFFLVLPWSLPCSWGHHLGFYLRRYSPTLPKLAGARCWYRSRFSLSLCTSAPPSLLSWYVMTTLFIIFFFSFLFVWILILFLIPFWNRTAYIPY